MITICNPLPEVMLKHLNDFVQLRKKVNKDNIFFEVDKIKDLFLWDLMVNVYYSQVTKTINISDPFTEKIYLKISVKL